MGREIVKPKQLTLKQRKFVKKYCTCIKPKHGMRWAFGNGTESVMQVYNVKRRVIAGLMAKQLFRKPHIREAIEQEVQRQNLLSF